MKKKLSNKTIIIKYSLKPKAENIRDYLEVLEQTKIAVEASEIGSLDNFITKAHKEENTYYWLNIFKCEYDLIFHLNNPVMCLFWANNEFLGNEYLVEVFGNTNNESSSQINMIHKNCSFYKREFD